MPADNKQQLTLKLRPRFMAALRAEADNEGVPAEEFLEDFIKVATLSPDGVKLKLHEVKMELPTATEGELPLGGGRAPK